MKEWATSPAGRRDNMDHGVLFEVNGVKKHSYVDFGLFMNNVKIPYPEVKSEYIDIEGADGTLDLTECYGQVFYKDRKFSLTFQCNVLNYEFIVKRLANFLHGQKVKMTFYFDTGYYYIGRVTVKEYDKSKGMGQVKMDVTVNPYKYKQKISTTINDIKEKAIIIYNNERMFAIPTFKTTASMNFIFEGNSYALNAGEAIVPNVIFKPGNNVITWTGTGIAEVSYQEGSF